MLRGFELTRHDLMSEYQYRHMLSDGTKCCIACDESSYTAAIIVIFIPAINFLLKHFSLIYTLISFTMLKQIN